MPGERHDVVIVGAGIVGLATAYQLLAARPSTRVAVIEKELAVGGHQSGHNSGVIHSGLYYKPGSLKANLCRAGRAELESFADRNGIPWERSGKVIVAVDESEDIRFAALHERGVANGLRGLAEIGPAELRDLEPNVKGRRALLVPETGIIDFGEVTRALAKEVGERGGSVLLGRPVHGLAPDGRDQRVLTSDGSERARVVVTCAGLHADRVAVNGQIAERVVPFRGVYFRLAPRARELVRGLVYPVPDPRLPFLGVHFTRRLDGEMWVGPSAILSLAREGYARGAVNRRDLTDILRFGGFWRMATRHWRFGAVETLRDRMKPVLVRELRRYVPAITSADLLPGPTGVRAQLVGNDGKLIDDFCLKSSPGCIRVLNAPSPAATAALAIGRHLANQAFEQLDAVG